jgi:hypothetical protein
MRPATDGEPTKVRQLVGNIDLDHRGVIGGWSSTEIILIYHLI